MEQLSEARGSDTVAVAGARNSRDDNRHVFDFAVASQFNHVRRLEEIPYRATLAIYGPNVVGRTLHRMIAEGRSDLTVFCFLDAFRNGQLEDVPIFHPEETARFVDQVDYILVTQLYKLDCIA